MPDCCTATHKTGGAEDAPEVRCELPDGHDGPHSAPLGVGDFTATWADPGPPPMPEPED